MIKAAAIIFILFLLSCTNGDEKSSPPEEHKKPDTVDYSSETPATDSVHRYEYQIDPSEVNHAPNEPITEQDDVKKYENLLMFDVEDTMEVNETYKATLGLAKDESIEQLKLEVQQTNQDRGKLYIDTSLKIASTMKARLIDPHPTDNPNFKIVNIGDEIQEIDSLTDNKAFWQWSIEPLKEGQHKLELVVEIVVNKRKHTLPSKTVPVIIYSKPVSFFSGLSKFFGDNWQWLISAILIPLIIAYFTIRSNKERHAAEVKLKEERNSKKTIKRKS